MVLGESKCARYMYQTRTRRGDERSLISTSLVVHNTYIPHQMFPAEKAEKWKASGPVG